MAIDLEDEILQDFLVEAGEILEQLNEQMVDLEQSPDDKDLLNSIFRGFHTIKGGGSFLALTNLVEICHQSEDIFNLLRNQELRIDASMMDVFSRVLDKLNGMFDEIRAGEDPSVAEASLLQQLLQLQTGEVVQVIEIKEEPEGSKTDAAASFIAGDDEITDDEFESLLDALQGKPAGSGEDSEKTEVKDSENLLIAGWFHDVGYIKGCENHEENSAKIAAEFLENQILDNERKLQRSQSQPCP